MGKAPGSGIVAVGSKRTYDGTSPNIRRNYGEQILARRNKGEHLHAICADLGLNERTGKRYMQLALESRLVPTVDDFRKQQNDRLDATQRSITENLEVADRIGREGIARGDFSMVERAVKMRSDQIALQLRLDERRARLNGIDAPVKVDATVVTVTPADLEMEEAIRAAKAKMMLDDQQETAHVE